MLCICKSIPMDGMGLQFQKLSIKISFLLARPFTNYFVLNISSRSATFHLAYTGSLMTATSNRASWVLKISSSSYIPKTKMRLCNNCHTSFINCCMLCLSVDHHQFVPDWILGAIVSRLQLFLQATLFTKCFTGIGPVLSWDHWSIWIVDIKNLNRKFHKMGTNPPKIYCVLHGYGLALCFVQTDGRKQNQNQNQQCAKNVLQRSHEIQANCGRFLCAKNWQRKSMLEFLCAKRGFH